MGALGQQLTVNDQTRFDGLAETYLIRQQHARGMATGDLIGDIELMRDETGTRTRQTIQHRLRQPGLLPACCTAQAIKLGFIDLPGEQAIRRPAELHEVIELAFRQHGLTAICAPAEINQQTIRLLNCVDLERPAVMTANGVTLAKLHAR